MASEFKIGDKVRFNDTKHPRWVGQEGEILELHVGEGVTYRITKAAPTDLGPQWNTVGKTVHNGLDQVEKILPLPVGKAKGGLTNEAVEHPAHYGGADNPYEVIKVAEAWGLDKDAYLFNVLKYIGRNGKKDGNPPLQDLKKGLFYYQRRIKQLEEEQSA